MRPYRPSNGAEGADFIGAWCGRCKRDAAYRAGTGDSCPIVASTMVYSVNDPNYPAEWVQNDDDVFGSSARCTAFEEDR